MELKEFQAGAIRQLLDAIGGPSRNIVLKSPTGSGKTLILTHLMQQYLRSTPGTVFVWLTPGKGNLEEQSREKMDRYFHGAQTKLLPDVMTAGFEENDCCFINWEKLTKKGNNALKEGERLSFLERVRAARAAGLRFLVIVDESHQNNTVKAEEILRLFHAEKILRCSATPQETKGAVLVEISEESVIAEGLIKKMLIISEDFPSTVEAGRQIDFLLERAYQKQQDLAAAYRRLGKPIHPLLIVQLPNQSQSMQDSVTEWFARQGVTLENGRLAVWLSDRHENLDGIEQNGARPAALLMKQAVATGWDCPRAQILVKLRGNMDETFEIQTIGRIRRMPEARHYGCDLLDSCYLYTFDEKFTTGVKQSLGKNALDACTLPLKEPFRTFSLTSEQRTMVADSRDPQRALHAAAQYFAKSFHTGGNKAQNAARLQAAGFVLSENVVRHTISGKTATLDRLPEGLATVAVTEQLSTHAHGRDYHQRVSRIGLEIGLPYAYMNTILRKLFDQKFQFSGKILALEPRAVYAFVLNNADRLRRAFREAMAADLAQTRLEAHDVSKVPFRFPTSCFFTYDAKAKNQAVLRKNVYENYRASAEPRSSAERKFEKYCETSPRVEWFYKNGGKGNEYLSIVYEDNAGKQRNFYPDYLVGANGETWVIETKGGFDRGGNSQDIDLFTPKKFEVLRDYLSRYGLKGGIVRNDEKSGELCICTSHYSDALESSDWTLLSEVL